jgi:hypothetical protein
MFIPQRLVPITGHYENHQFWTVAGHRLLSLPKRKLLTFQAFPSFLVSEVPISYEVPTYLTFLFVIFSIKFAITWSVTPFLDNNSIPEQLANPWFLAPDFLKPTHWLSTCNQSMDSHLRSSPRMEASKSSRPSKTYRSCRKRPRLMSLGTGIICEHLLLSFKHWWIIPFCPVLLGGKYFCGTPFWATWGLHQLSQG